MSNSIGCGDNSCVFRVLRTGGGMATNGGCRCFERRDRTESRDVERDTRRLAVALRESRAEVARLTEERDAALAFAEAETRTADILGLDVGRLTEERNTAQAEVTRLKAQIATVAELVEYHATTGNVPLRQLQDALKPLVTEGVE